MISIALICLVSALLLALRPNAWVKATATAEYAATQLASDATNTEHISWQLAKDKALLRTIIWDRRGSRLYPPETAMVPTTYNVSEDTIERIAHFQAQVRQGDWQVFDEEAGHMLFCQSTPAVCLIYDQSALEEVLDLLPGALGANTWDLAAIVALLVFGLPAGTYGVWVWQRKSGDDASRLRINADRYTALYGGREVPLTQRDLKLLQAPDSRNGGVVTKDELYDAAWGREYMPNSRTLDQHVITLRRKLDPDKTHPVLIETVRGVGYKLVQ
ncbi:transcriptional regulatory protein [Roseibium sp. TrichSKD4]|nr:transcriptional regulatory protein [Roseibium sp. TrichSKD4]